MPYAECLNCGNNFHWNWEDAFDKFGFGDGDGQVMTQEVTAALEAAGYSVKSYQWGMHNEIIVGVFNDGIDQIPVDAQRGYDNPRDYLPAGIVTLLDTAFSDEEGVR